MRGLSTAAKKNLRVDPGGLKNPKHQKCEKNNSRKKKKTFKTRERISDHPGSSMSNKLTNSPSPVRSTDLFDAEPSIPIAVQSQEPQRSLALERRSTGNQWKPMVVYAVLPTQPGRVSSNLSFQLGRSFGKNPATHLPVLLLKTTLRPSI